MAGQEILGKRFRAFQLAAPAVGPKIFSPAARKVSTTLSPAALPGRRWSDRSFRFAQIQQRRDIGYADSDVLQCGFSAVPALPGATKTVSTSGDWALSRPARARARRYQSLILSSALH